MKLNLIAAFAALFIFFSESAFAQQGVGIDVNNPLEKLDVAGAIKIGTDINDTNAAPSGGAGTIRFRTGQFEGWDGAAWIPLGGGGGISPFLVDNNLVQPDNTLVDLATDDFIFGSPSLDDNANTANDARFFFDKSKGAFRAGSVAGDQWDDVKRGNQSFAAGFDVTASGDYAISLGERSRSTGIAAISLGTKAYAYGDHSFAWGYDVEASGEGAITLGRFSVASANYSYAIGSNVNATGPYSLAFGANANATDPYAFALGANVTASNESAFVLGLESSATGVQSSALGYNVVSSGDNSVSFGHDLTSLSGYEVVMGRYNSTYVPTSTNSWEPTDRLFSIGNGSSSVNRSNALTILKNGNTGLGTTTPSATLHVDGSLRYVDGNQQAGFVATSDSNGNMVWTDPTTITTAADGDGDASNELQTLTQSGTDVTLSDGGGTISVADNDDDATNEIQTLSLTGNTLAISGSNDLDLSGYVSSDNQNLTGATLTGTTLEIDIEDGTSATVDLSALVDDADADASNELQSLSVSGADVTLSNGGGTVTVNDGDWSVNGNNQVSAVSGNVGIGMLNPASKLHIEGTTIDETGGFRFTSPGGTGVMYLNSTNDIVLRKLNQVDQLVLDIDGNVGVGTNAPGEELHVEGSIRMVDGNQAVGYIPVSDVNGTMVWTDPTTITTAADGDGDASNELQTLSLTGNTLAISGSNDVDLSGYVSSDDQNLTGATLTGTSLQIDIEGGSSTTVDLSALVDDADADASNELQTLSQSGIDVTLSNGGGTISVADNDNDASNEIQTLSLTGNTLAISGSNDVDLSGYVSSDDQNLTGATLTGTTLQIDIESGSSATVDLSGLVNDADADASNELQALSQSGTNVTLSNGGGTISVADNDNDASNELQALSISGNDITLSDGGGTVSVPVQTVLADADGDTQIQVEESADEDIIRFDVDGTEAFRIEKLANTYMPIIGMPWNSFYVGNNISPDAPAGSNVAIGWNSATALTSSSTGNTFVGSGAGRYTTAATNNTYLGLRAGLTATTGSSNTTVGAYAGEDMVNGDNNVILGAAAAYNKTGGNNNVLIGLGAGENGGTGASNVFIGYRAGRNETGSNKLFIENSGSANPLIYGEFDNDIVGVNGKLGVGTSAPNAKLEVSGAESTTHGTDAAIRISNSSAGGDAWLLRAGATGTQTPAGGFSIAHASGYRMVINSGGDVGFGTTTPDTKLHVSSSTTGEATGFKLTQDIANSLMYHNADNDLVIRKAAQTDQLVLDNGGNIGVGTAAPSAKLHVTTSGLNGFDNFAAIIANTSNFSNYSNGLKIVAGQDFQTDNNRFISFRRPDGTEVGAVRQTSSASVTFWNPSDQRLKTNIQTTSMGLADLMHLQVKDYVYKDDPAKPQTGFIAQEVYEVFPNAVSVGGDDPKTDPWMMNYGNLTPLLVKAVQDLTELVEEQQRRIEELEAQR